MGVGNRIRGLLWLYALAGAVIPIVLLMACGDGDSSPTASSRCGSHDCSTSGGTVSEDTGSGGALGGANSLSTSQSGTGGSTHAYSSNTAQGGFDAGFPPDASDANVPDAGDCNALPLCNDNNACTKDECSKGACVFTPLPDGTACDDGVLCNVAAQCLAGNCVGTAQSTLPTVLSTGYAYGGADVVSGNENGRAGFVAFLSPDRLIFADWLDSDSTVISLAEIGPSGLVLSAQAVTDSRANFAHYSAYLWQPIPVAHLVPLPNQRFALFSATRIQVYQIDNGQLTELSRKSINSNIWDAVSANGALWACSDSSIVRYTVAASGNLVEVPVPELVPFGGCLRLAVTPDGNTVYAANLSQSGSGIFRWSVSSDGTITPEMVLPGVAALDMAVDGKHLVLQRAGQLDQLGDTEVYRLSDWKRQTVFPQVGADHNFGFALSNGKLLLQWVHEQAQSSQVTAAIYDLNSDTPPLINQWPIRSRSVSISSDTWSPFAQRLVANGNRFILGPWHHVIELDPATLAATPISGPGNGELSGLRSAGNNTAVTYSPYSIEQLDLTAGVRFVGGGMRMPPDVQRLQVVLPDVTATPSSFDTIPEVMSQRAETETVTVLRSSSANGLEVAGQFTLNGGPAALLQRGNSLFQIAPVGTADYLIRRFTLGANKLGQSPLVAEEETSLTVQEVPTDWRRTQFFYPDIDPERGQLAISEFWSVGTAGATTYSTIWASYGGGSAEVFARMVSESDVGKPLVRGGRLMLFSELQAAVLAPDGAGNLKTVAKSPWTGGNQAPLGMDGNRVYVTANNGMELYVLNSADTSVLGHVPLPDAVHSAIAVDGHRLLLGSNHSVTLLAPACGAPAPPPAPDGGTGDGGSDGGGGTDAGVVCGTVANCPAGGLIRSTLVGDINQDGCVDAADLTLVHDCVGKSVSDHCGWSYLADLDGNGIVDIRDYVKANLNRGKGCDAGP